MSRSVSQESTKKVLRDLAHRRLEDIRDGFEEELEETTPRKRKRDNIERLTDSEDEELEVTPRERMHRNIEGMTDNEDKELGETTSRKRMRKSIEKLTSSEAKELEGKTSEKRVRKNIEGLADSENKELGGRTPGGRMHRIIEKLTSSEVKEVEETIPEKRMHRNIEEVTDSEDKELRETISRKRMRKLTNSEVTKLEETTSEKRMRKNIEGLADNEDKKLRETTSRKRMHKSIEKLSGSEDDNVFNESPTVLYEQDGESKGAALLAKMGYTTGGLGKSGQGRMEPIPFSTQRGREGLGHRSDKEVHRDWSAVWHSTEEEKVVKEKVFWLEADENVREKFMKQLQDDWIVVDSLKQTLDDENKYCDGELVKRMLDAKSVFDQLSERDLWEARSRANPYETIGSAFFQNRAAMKMANLDRIYDYKLTNEKTANIEVKNPMETKHEKWNTDRKSPMFYFADICAGPGGFTEYVLWRKGFYNAKGFGMTLKGKDDFKLSRFMASSPLYFEPYYGKHNDGDVTKPENIISFEEFVRSGTHDAGVDLLMADGGFCVDQQENIQEILSKRLYLCQFLVALSILRTKTSDKKSDHESASGGKFVCKLFDIFTPFSVGLIYLMYIVFQRISIHKPVTSRPANSERYIVCDNPLECYISKIKNYMTKINNELDRLSENKARDVREIVPEAVIQADETFKHYIVEHNKRIVKRQILYLEKYKVFAQNVNLLDCDQSKLREECLRYWKIPDIPKKKPREMHEPLYTAIGRLVKSINFEDLQRKPPALTRSVLSSSCATHIRCAELRMCAITEKKPPVLLLSVQMGIYFYSPQSSQGFERIPFDAAIPKDTVLLVQFTKAYKGLDDKGRMESEFGAIRILDAAILNGDDVSALPFDLRMEAAGKMCQAVKVVHASPNGKIAPLFVAKIFKMDKLGSEMRRFHVIRTKGEEVAVIEEGEDSPLFFCCRGMRVISILVDGWIMSRSKTQGKKYAFNKIEGSSFFKDHFEKEHCCVDFWKTITIRKHMQGSDMKNDCYQWLWDWTQNFLDGEDYGPRTILEAEYHPGGLTWRSIQNIAQQQSDNVCFKHSS